MSLSASVEDRLREIRARYSHKPENKPKAKISVQPKVHHPQSRSTTKSYIEKQNVHRESTAPKDIRVSQRRPTDNKMEEAKKIKSQLHDIMNHRAIRDEHRDEDTVSTKTASNVDIQKIKRSIRQDLDALKGSITKNTGACRPMHEEIKEKIYTHREDRMKDYKAPQKQEFKHYDAIKRYPIDQPSKKQRQMQRQRQKEKFLRDRERQREREKEKGRERDWERQKEKERQRQREKEKMRDNQREMQKDRENQRQREREKQRERERERERDRFGQMKKEKNYQKDREKDRQRTRQREMIRERIKQREKQRQRYGQQQQRQQQYERSRTYQRSRQSLVQRYNEIQYTKPGNQQKQAPRMSLYQKEKLADNIRYKYSKANVSYLPEPKQYGQVRHSFNGTDRPKLEQRMTGAAGSAGMTGSLKPAQNQFEQRLVNLRKQREQLQKKRQQQIERHQQFKRGNVSLPRQRQSTTQYKEATIITPIRSIANTSEKTTAGIEKGWEDDLKRIQEKIKLIRQQKKKVEDMEVKQRASRDSRKSLHNSRKSELSMRKSSITEKSKKVVTIRSIINDINQQIHLDQSLRQLKSCKQMTTQQRQNLSQFLQEKGVYMNDRTIAEQFQMTAQQINPFQENTIFKAKQLVTAYLKSTSYWDSKVCFHPAQQVQQLAAQLCKDDSSIESLVRLVNYEMKTFYKKRDLVLVSRRLGGEPFQKEQVINFLTKK